jgi:hypothetical protein
VTIPEPRVSMPEQSLRMPGQRPNQPIYYIQADFGALYISATVL